jgi:hypothetical protein
MPTEVSTTQNEEVVDLAKDPNQRGPLARSTTELRRDKSLADR